MIDTLLSSPTVLNCDDKSTNRSKREVVVIECKHVKK